MCYKVQCQSCKKYTWAGCGKHLATVYAGIEKGKHCECRSWPGVVIPKDKDGSSSKPSATATTSSSK